jgi:hypothetical protein
MRHRLNGYGVALAAVLLVLAPAAALLAAEEEAVSLTGQLTTDEAGAYVLIEQESGDSIVLRGSSELADHVGSMVKITGKWAEDSEGYKYFEVSKVAPV